MIARVSDSTAQNLFLSSRLGLVSVPGSGVPDAPADGDSALDRGMARERLRLLGHSLALTVLEPRADEFPEGAEADGEGPVFPDAAVRRTLESLDMVWLDGEGVAAAFAIETGSASGDGLRRLADLLALHPKLKAPLYVVTLPALKPALLAEINRPVYRLLKKSLGEAVRLLDWNRLDAEVRELGERVRYLKPAFLEGISEVVDPPSA